MLLTSGTAETTTLRMMAGLEMPTSGQICIDGEEVGHLPASRRDIAFVFQMFALYPHINVRKNISYPKISQGMSRKAARAKVEEVSRILGIEDVLERPVGGLSGDDRQRVALGRGILRESKVFFMDEPLGALDAEFREPMAEGLRALHDRMEATTVDVTHDPDQGNDHGEPRRRARSGTAGAVRFSARDRRGAGQRLCRKPPRPAAHQHPARGSLRRRPKSRAKSGCAPSRSGRATAPRAGSSGSNTLATRPACS
ncbi:MAG: ATP-binding cassette domain-containing protein [Salipiger thiooxidans]|uniref:ABC transporter ATP-binding protein n=1 Tax=Salipiger thiooxidans TaxID=282683 RepID=UPI00299F16E8|nr:ABC transporter ATP-binding protein [Salipiger thiooxidans]